MDKYLGVALLLALEAYALLELHVAMRRKGGKGSRDA